MSELINLSGTLPFYISANDISWRIRERWIEEIDSGHNPLIDTVIPYFEREAIFRLKRELPELAGEWPLEAESDELRLWWLNEARQNCGTHGSIWEAGNHLSAIGQASVNILIIASDMRNAINSNLAGKSAALGMLLMCEVISAGFETEPHLLKKIRKDAYKKGLGKQDRDFDLARKASIDMASKIWKENQNMLISDVAKKILEAIKSNGHRFSELEAFPKVGTIKTWLRAAAKADKLLIPSVAQRPGRRAKTIT